MKTSTALELGLRKHPQGTCKLNQGKSFAFSRSLTSFGKAGDHSIKFLTTASPPIEPVESLTGSTMVIWEAGENGSDSLEFDRRDSRLWSAGACTAGLLGLTSSADGEILNGSGPLSVLLLPGLDLSDWDLVILSLLRGVGRKERRFWAFALSDVLFVTLQGTAKKTKILMYR